MKDICANYKYIILFLDNRMIYLILFPLKILELQINLKLHRNILRINVIRMIYNEEEQNMLKSYSNHVVCKLLFKTSSKFDFTSKGEVCSRSFELL